MKKGNRTLKGIGVLVIAAGFITAGVMRGELIVIFTKAVRICLECIGLG